MSAERIIKAQAKEKLRHGGWAKALFAMAIVAVMYMIIECIASIEYSVTEIFDLSENIEFIVKVISGSVVTVTVLLLSPVILGFFRMMYTENEEYDIKDILYYFSSMSRYGKAVSFIFSYFLRLLFPALLFSMIPAVVIVLRNYVFEDAMSGVIYDVILWILIACSVIQLLRYNVVYFVSILLLCKNEEAPVSYYFKTSRKIMRGHQRDVVKLTFSFAWWILLCITVLPALYVIPYIAQAMCISGKWITQLSRDGQDL